MNALRNVVMTAKQVMSVLRSVVKSVKDMQKRNVVVVKKKDVKGMEKITNMSMEMIMVTRSIKI